MNLLWELSSSTVIENLTAVAVAVASSVGECLPRVRPWHHIKIGCEWEVWLSESWLSSEEHSPQAPTPPCYMVSAENQLRFSGTAACVLSHWASSPTSTLLPLMSVLAVSVWNIEYQCCWGASPKPHTHHTSARHWAGATAFNLDFQEKSESSNLRVLRSNIYLP